MVNTSHVGTRRIEWGPAVGGAFCATAIAVILELFGAAFSLGGLTVLGGVWQIVTPLVATFFGAVLATSMVGRRGYLTGFMVWCLTLAFAALVAAVLGQIGATPRTPHALAVSGSTMALAGLAGILGLVGALLGAAVGSVSAERRIIAFESRTVTSGGRPSAQMPATGEARRIPPQAEPTETRH